MTFRATYSFTMTCAHAEPMGARETHTQYADRLKRAETQARDTARFLDRLAEWGWTIEIDRHGSLHFAKMMRTLPDRTEFEHMQVLFAKHNVASAYVSPFDEDSLIIEQLDDDESGVFSYHMQLFNDLEDQVPNSQLMKKVQAAGWQDKLIETTRDDIFYQLTRRCDSRFAAAQSLKQLLGDEYDVDSLEVHVPDASPVS